LEPAATISGTVRLPDGSPIEGALVEILEHYRYDQGGCSANSTTDTKGRYELKRLLPSSYDIRVTPPPHLAADWTADLTAITLDSAEHRKNLDLLLDKGGVVTGRITLSDTGEPVPNFLVGATSQRSKSPLHLWWAVTDENGFYRHRLPSGNRKIYAGGSNPKGYTTRSANSSQMAFELIVDRGGEHETNFALLPESSITGIVVDPSGVPVAGAKVTCLSPLNLMSQPETAICDENGAFNFTLPAGTESAQIIAEFEGKVSKEDTSYPTSGNAKLVLID
jgi:hypothetical protein